MSLLSNARRSLLSSVSGLFISFIVLARLLTSRSNTFCSCLASSCCRGSHFSLFSLDASIIQRLRAAGFPVKPTAPPSSFTVVLFCSLRWSMAITKNLCAVFLTTKIPFRTFEMNVFQCNHLSNEQGSVGHNVWSNAKNQGTILVRAFTYSLKYLSLIVFT